MASRAYEKNIQNPSVSGHAHVYRNCNYRYIHCQRQETLKKKCNLKIHSILADITTKQKPSSETILKKYSCVCI